MMVDQTVSAVPNATSTPPAEAETTRLDLRLCAIAVLAGLVAGGVGALFRAALTLIQEVRIEQVVALQAAWPVGGLVVVIVVCTVLGGLAGWLVFRFVPEATGSGIPHVEVSLRSGVPLRWKRLLPTKFFGGMFAIAAGMSLGREGPTVQMGAAGAEAIAHSFGLTDRVRRALVAAGAGAGLTAAFNAPIGGFLFVIEELRRDITVLTYSTALIATVTSDLVIRATLGPAPVLGVDNLARPPLVSLPWFAALGIVAAVVGLAFNRALLSTLDAFTRWRRGPRWIHTAVAGAAAALMVWWFSDATGGGEVVATHFIHADSSMADPFQYLALLLVLKFLLTLVSYGSGAPGGLFAPLLVIGAALGGFFGHVVNIAMPSAPPFQCFALSGMVGVFTASVRVPVTGIVLIMEMTDGVHQMLPFAVTATVAYIVAARLGGHPIYEALVARDSHRRVTMCCVGD